jgi:carbonic anhydrase/acetyltransferase-like protein (isoleucine patch superfamily)
MALIRSVRGFTPQFGKDCFLAENATIVGDVIMGDECSIWFNAVVRGDVNSIRLGNRVNVQDGAVIHCTYERSKTLVADNVSIGHNAIVHGCEIEEKVLVGMGAIIMDLAVVKTNTIVAAGAVVLQKQLLEPNSIYAGTPAKKVKAIDENLSVNEIERIAANYMKYASWFK